MKQAMKFCLLLMVIVIGAAIESWAVPPLPHSLYGTVKNDGVNVPDGTPVTAWIGGISYASTATTTFGTDSVYSLNVSGDDPDTTAKDGGTSGDVISFTVGSVTAAQTATFSSGATTNLNLTTSGQYTLTVNISPTAGGSVSRNPNKNTYSFGEQVILTAASNAGYAFSNWSGGATGSTNQVTVTMNGNATVTANFTQTTPNQHTLTVDVIGSGSVGKNPDKLTYDQWEQVVLTAIPGSGFTFSNWSGDVSGTANPIALTVNGNEKVTAYFTQTTATQYTLTVNVVGSGSFAKNPDKLTYNQGEQVTLTASPASGFTFSSWSGDTSGTTNPITLTMSGNKTITANFSAVTGTLVITPSISLSASGPMGGPFSPFAQTYILENKGGGTINWNASQTRNWVSLSSNSGYLPAGASTTVTVSINSDANTFGAGFYGDTVTFSNPTNGNGTTTRSVGLNIGSINQGYTVATDPPGLSVVVDGVNYKSPQTFNWIPASLHTVSLTSPQFGPSGAQYAFGSWSDGGAQSHTLTASSSNPIYVASFMTQYSLTTSINPSGGGQVNPSGMKWYNQGESVLVSAAGNPGYTFSGWSGDLSSTVNPTFVVVSRPKVITGNFSSEPCSLTVNVNPVGLGTIIRDPDKSIYATGEQVILTAKPNEGYSFKNWSGGATGEMNPLTLAIKENMTLTANFASTGSLEAIPLAGLSASGRQGGTFSPSSQTYTLRNRGQIPVKWKVSKKPRWVTLSLTSGSLAAGEGVQVEVSINSSARQLKMGSYSDAIVFSNASNGNDSLSRSAAIAISPPIKTYTFKTKPEGLQVIVDGVTYTSSQTFEWEVGSSHTLDVPSPQTSSPGTQSVFSSWSNRKSQNQTITAPSSGTTYTANFKTQYVLTTLVTPPEGGIVTPSGMTWVNQGQRVSVTAKPNEGYQFLNWSGDSSGSRSPASFTIKGPMTLVANFAKIGTQGANEANAPASMKSFSANMPMVGALESPSEGKRVMGQKTIYGWALDEEGISKVKLLIDGEYVCDIPYGGLREDLKQSYPDYPNAEKGGFALIWNYSSLSPGVHVVQVDIQNMKGEVLRLSANVMIHKFSADMITQVNPNEWLIPGVNLTADGNTKTYDLKLEWSNESQAFEIIDLFSP